MNLTHSYTPKGLKDINHKLEELLHNKALDELDENRLTVFNQLIDVRHQFISDYVTTLTAHTKQAFVEHELQNNEWLVNLAKTQCDQVAGVLAKFKRDGRAISQYT